jgi:hypothetical protein
MRINPGHILIVHRHMNVESWTEAAQFPEKEYINGIFVAVHCLGYCNIVAVVRKIGFRFNFRPQVPYGESLPRTRSLSFINPPPPKKKKSPWTTTSLKPISLVCGTVQ